MFYSGCATLGHSEPGQEGSLRSTAGYVGERERERERESDIMTMLFNY
ncbi:MAG: hypothetical protein MJE68_18195 [Proteobacteria bacterium]|nr:hypothetical protein [Pseudomonadota bacterium]